MAGLPRYGDGGMGFAQAGHPEMRQMLNMQEQNRKIAIEKAKREYPGAKVSGDVIYTTVNGRLKSLGKLDKTILDKGLPATSSQRKNIGKPYDSSKDRTPEQLRAELDKERAKYPAAPTPTEEEPIPEPTPELPTRETLPPNGDPNRTGQSGTITGLSGGSVSQPFSNEGFVEMLGRQGIRMQNPFDSNVQPGTIGGNSQQRLNPGVLKQDGEFGMGGDFTFSQYVDTPAPISNTTDVKFETGRTLSPDDTTDSEGPTNWMKNQRTSDMDARSMAFLNAPMGAGYGAIRAADAAQGLGRQGVGGNEKLMAMDAEGNLQNVTEEGYNLRKTGQIDAQTLLDKYLKDVPKDAVETAVETGDADSVTNPDAASTFTMGGDQPFSTVINSESDVDFFEKPDNYLIGEGSTEVDLDGLDTGAMMSNESGFFSNTRRNIRGK